MSIEAYKAIQTETESVIDLNIRFLESMKADIVDGMNGQFSKVERVMYLSRAQQICLLFIEYMNDDVVDEERSGILTILVGINNNVTKKISGEVVDLTETISSINTLIKILKGVKLQS